MGDIINLNQYRKAQARAGAAKQAEANRRRYGRTKAEREKEALEEAQRQSRHEKGRLEDTAKPKPDPQEPPRSA